MTRLHQVHTRWLKSDPTLISSVISSYSCTYDERGRACGKFFSRQCDLNRHQKNHVRRHKCKVPACSKEFPSPKDLERYDNSVHNTTVKYFCPYDWCRDCLPKSVEECQVWGFRRKDHWQKHMRDEHNMQRDMVRGFQKKGIPMAVLKDGNWLAVLPSSKKSESFVLERVGGEESNGDIELPDDHV